MGYVRDGWWEEVVVVGWGCVGGEGLCVTGVEE